MRHVISKDISIEEFQKEFSEIREAFLNSLKTSVEDRKDVKYFSCNESGEPVKWVWDDDSFTYNKEEGSLEDALQFAESMINEGMCFAFMGCTSVSGGFEIWLMAVEAPLERPVWPSDKTPEFELSHEGVTRE